VSPNTLITAAHCLQNPQQVTQQARTTGTFRIDRGPGRSATYDVVEFAAFGGTFDIALVRLDRNVSADIARPVSLASRAPRAGEPLVRFGYGRIGSETTANVKRVYRYAAGGDPSRTTYGDSGGPTFGPAGLHLITSGESEHGAPIQIEVQEWLQQIQYKLANWRAVCPEGVVDAWSVCDASMTTMSWCWLGYVEAQRCMRGCVSGDFEGEGASCEEDLRPCTGSDCGGGTEHYESSHAPRAIPDLNATGVSSEIAVSQSGAIETLTVAIELTHSFPYDLTVQLSRDGGTPIVLLRESSASGPSLRETFTVDAFAGAQASGTWRLTVIDGARVDVGTLDRWSMDITTR
jgi:hypothetical protein